VRRVTLSAPEIAWFGRHGADHFVRMLFAPNIAEAPALPLAADWWGELRALPERDRPALRNYTVRHLRPQRCELDVDFVLHGETGPGSRWALHATAGRTVGLIDQYSRYAPGPPHRWQLICGDETALPAIGGILAALPSGTRAEVFVEVPSADDVPELRTAGEAHVRWFPRDETRRGHGTGLLEGVRRAQLPAGTPYAWVAGEAGMVASLRHYLTVERGASGGQAHFSGYWRHDRPAYD